MDEGVYKKELKLEDQLFRNILYLGIVAVVLLMIYDGFFTKYYHSVAIELFAGIVFLVYLFAFRNRNINPPNIYVFSTILFVLMNLGWITGSGVNLTNAAVYFLLVAVVLILNDSKIYPVLFILIFLDLVFLFSLQYFTDLWINEKYIKESQGFMGPLYYNGCFYYGR
jgi:hypothetical protein